MAGKRRAGKQRTARSPGRSGAVRWALVAISGLATCGLLALTGLDWFGGAAWKERVGAGVSLALGMAGLLGGMATGAACLAWLTSKPGESIVRGSWAAPTVSPGASGGAADDDDEGDEEA